MNQTNEEGIEKNKKESLPSFPKIDENLASNSETINNHFDTSNLAVQNKVAQEANFATHEAGLVDENLLHEENRAEAEPLEHQFEMNKQPEQVLKESELLPNNTKKNRMKKSFKSKASKSSSKGIGGASSSALADSSGRSTARSASKSSIYNQSLHSNMSLGSEMDDVTRCVCGVQDDNGMTMIQCEKCSVWQHVDCMNLKPTQNSNNQLELPEVYFCEECKPHGHPFYDLFRGSASSRNKTSQSSTRKRNTLNSRYAEDDLIFLKVLEDSKLEAEKAAAATASTSPLQGTTKEVEEKSKTLNLVPSSLSLDDSISPEFLESSVTQVMPSSTNSVNSSAKKKRANTISLSAPAKRKRKSRAGAKDSFKYSSDIENDSSLHYNQDYHSDGKPALEHILEQETYYSSPTIKQNSPIKNETLHDGGIADSSTVSNHVSPVEEPSIPSSKFNVARRKIKKFSDMHKRVQQMLDYLIESSLISDPALYTPTCSANQSSSSVTLTTLALCATAPSQIVDAKNINVNDEWERGSTGTVLEGDLGHVGGLLYSALLRFQNKWETH